MSRKRLSSTLAVFAAALWAAAWPAAPSLACPACFGETDSPMAHAADLSILFMMATTYAVILGGVAVAVALRVKARRKNLAGDARS